MSNTRHIRSLSNRTNYFRCFGRKESVVYHRWAAVALLTLCSAIAGLVGGRVSAQTDSLGNPTGEARGEISRPLEPPKRPTLQSNGATPLLPTTAEFPLLAQTPPPLADTPSSALPTSENETANPPVPPTELPFPALDINTASGDGAKTPLPQASGPSAANALPGEPNPILPGDPNDLPNPVPNLAPNSESNNSPSNTPNSIPNNGPNPQGHPTGGPGGPNGPRRGPGPVQVVIVPTDAKEAAETPSAETTTEENQEASLLASQLRTPRLTFENLLKSAVHNNYEQAAKALDFSDRPGISEKEKKALTYNLHFVINHLSEPDFKSIPNDESLTEYAYQPNANYPPLTLIKKDGKFLFSPETVDKIGELYNALKNTRPAAFARIPVLCDLSDWWFQTTFGLRHIQWVLLAVVSVVGYLIGLFASKLLYYLTITSLHLMSTDLSEYKISKKTWRPIGWLLMYTFWYLGILAAQVPPRVTDIMGCPIMILSVLMFVTTGMRLIDIIALWGRKKIGGTKSKVDELLVPLLSRSSKIILVAIGVAMGFQAFGFSALGIVSGMGIGGIAIALAAQNTIANLFGSITVLMDRPFVIGDWIVTSSIEGEVETVGLRSTRIRTFYNSLVTVPNNLLTTAIIDNMGRRHFRRYKTTLGVQYDTPPDRIEAFCEGIRELILSYNFTRKDVFHVYANEFNASSIDILLVCFFLVPDTAAEYRARSTLILDIMRLAEKMDIRFAFPSRTIYNIRTQDKEYEEPLVSNDEFGRASASGIIERRLLAEKARHSGAFGEETSEKIAAVGELADTLSRKTDEVLKKRRFLRRAS